MIKEYQKYRKLILKLEKVNKNNSADYRFRLGVLAVLGYLFILAVLAVLVLICVGLIRHYMEDGEVSGSIRLLIFSLICIFYLIRALWVTIPAPTGLEIKRKDAPGLFKELDAISDFLQAPKFNVVLIDHDMNAAVSQVPRFGIFGWYKNYLIIGLPLMQALSLPEFRAVMVHELGHISGKHGKFSNWIWRLRTTFAKIQESFEGGAMNLLFALFFKWYSPLFMAYSSVLQRANEYEADRYSVKFTSPETFAQGLSKIAICGETVVSKTWQNIQLEVISRANAPEDIATRLSNDIKNGMADTAIEKLQKAMRVNTDIDDSHPCLRDRFTAIGISDLSSPARLEMLLKRSNRSAAEDLLGSIEKTFEMKLNQDLKKSMEAVWQAKHTEAKEKMNKLDALEAKEELTEVESLEKISLKSTLYGQESIKDEILTMREKWPDNMELKYMFGIVLLNDDNDAGIACIKEVMQADDRFQLYGNSVITGYLSSQGRDEEAEIFNIDGMRSAEKLEQLHNTMSQFNKKDVYLPHTYTEEELNAITNVVSKNKHIYRVYLVKKKLNIETKIEHHLLIIKPKFAGIVMDTSKEIKKIGELVNTEIEFKDVVYIIILADSSHNYVFKKLESVPNALIYQRKK